MSNTLFPTPPWSHLRNGFWYGTDRARCGLPPFLFRATDPVGEWLRYYLSREALFFVRGERWHRGDGRTFGQWLKAPGPLGPLTVDDWILHTSTAFPDLRFRGYLELRVADSVPLETLLGASALCKGLLGDPGRVMSWKDILPAPGLLSTRRNILSAARGGGLWSPAAGRGSRDAAPALFQEARRGLRAFGEDGGHLEPLERSAREGRCPADLWRRHPGSGWSGPDALDGVPEGSP